MIPALSPFASSLTTENAFDVLVIARKLKAAGKSVVELQIGDSPFPTPKHAVAAGKKAIDDGRTSYGPSAGLPEFREAAAQLVREEFGIPATADHIVAGAGAKPFQTYFCEAFLQPDDKVLVFEPAFPTFVPNILRRGAKPVFAPLKVENQFRPDLNAIASFLQNEPKAKAIFLNSPHNPTGGVATKEDLAGIADIVRNKGIAVFSDEPYCHMAWAGGHHSLLAEPDMIDCCVGAYTFSKSYSMSGWRLGFAVAPTAIAASFSKMINTTISCVPPFVQMAGIAALTKDKAERDETMAKFRSKVELLVNELAGVDDVKVTMPAGTFYVFPEVSAICERLGITSHGLAMFLLEGADEKFGVACLGGECFGPAGNGFLRFSCAEPDEKLQQAVAFLKEAVHRTDKVKAYLEAHPHYRR